MSCKVKTKSAAAAAGRQPPGGGGFRGARTPIFAADGGVPRERQLPGGGPRPHRRSAGPAPPRGGGPADRGRIGGTRHHPLVDRSAGVLGGGPLRGLPSLLRRAQARQRGARTPPLPAPAAPGAAGEAAQPLRDARTGGHFDRTPHPGGARRHFRAGGDRSVPLPPPPLLGRPGDSEQRDHRLLAGVPLRGRAVAGAAPGRRRPERPAGGRGPRPPLLRGEGAVAELRPRPSAGPRPAGGRAPAASVIAVAASSPAGGPRPGGGPARPPRRPPSKRSTRTGQGSRPRVAPGGGGPPPPSPW